MHEIVGLEMILHRNVDNYGNTVVHLAAESGYSSVFKVNMLPSFIHSTLPSNIVFYK